MQPFKMGHQAASMRDNHHILRPPNLYGLCQWVMRSWIKNLKFEWKSVCSYVNLEAKGGKFQTWAISTLTCIQLLKKNLATMKKLPQWAYCPLAIIRPSAVPSFISLANTQYPTPNTQRPELIANRRPLVVTYLSRSISSLVMLKMTPYHWCCSPLLSRAHCCTGHQFETKLKSAADMTKTLQGHSDRIKLDFME